MKLFRDPNETEPRIDIDNLYRFRINFDHRYITISRLGGAEKPYPVSELRRMISDQTIPRAVRDLARAALTEFNLLPRGEEPVSDTIVTIAGIKVYQELTGLRRFFIRLAGKIIPGSLTELEEKIKKGT